MKLILPALLLASSLLTSAQTVLPRPLRELYSSEFPFNKEAASVGWKQRRQDIRNRILLACGLLPLPTKTPLNAVIHGRIERDDYTIDRVFFESFPGHYVTGNLYQPKQKPKDGKMPGILCPHGHWPNGRFMDLGKDSDATNEQLAIGAERWESGARSPLQARCVQLVRMGCAVFFYDMLGYADSLQIADHRSGRREDLNGREPGTFGLYSAAADLRLQSNFGLQTWNGLRALDFILSLPAVDEKRISCTGASGGGTQTMILGAIDDRLATAFPCVMVSTAMQGGCTCENACYLRIGQGNIDIAGAFAPKPMGMTAADDWTKELQTKGFPDLQALWKQLGKPDNVTATFNTHWKHNYNHVSRTTMYGFMNKHFALGFKEPVLEREYVVSSKEELTVWTKEHPQPTGDQAGGAHEKALLKHWSEDSDGLIQKQPEIRRTAWELIVGRSLPAATDITPDEPEKLETVDGVMIARSTTRNTAANEEVNATYFMPPMETWNGSVVIWLKSEVPTEPDAVMKHLVKKGYAIALPELYLAGETKNPWNPVKSKDAQHNEWPWSACYTYGYNPPLLVQRVHDALTMLVMIKNHSRQPKKIILAASDGMGAVGALTAAMAADLIERSVIDTQGFRFASLADVQDASFVPGAVKYGDLPGILSLIDASNVNVLGEGGAEGGAKAITKALLK